MDLENIGREVLRQLEQGWNDGDGARFGAPFSGDADFVDIRGQHHISKQAIVAGHDGIFQSVYRGSRLEYALTHIRALADDILLMHSTGSLSAPSGPMAGQSQALQSIVLKREGEGWKIASFHNTVVAPTRYLGRTFDACKCTIFQAPPRNFRTAPAARRALPELHGKSSCRL